MRPTDFCHPIENDVHPSVACSRLLEPLSRFGTPRGPRGSARYDRGSPTFHAPETALANRDIDHVTPRRRPHGLRSRARAFSSRGVRCDPHLTSLSHFLLVLALTHFRACDLVLPLWVQGGHEGRRMKELPRPCSTQSRERPRFCMTRDAFHRKGPFVGSGGHFEPRSRDRCTAFDDPTTAGWRYHATLGLHRPLPLWSDTRATHDVRFARSARRRMTADVRSELGPRSLDPDRRFCGAYAELIWDQTSPTDFCNNRIRRTGNKPELLILAGTEAVTSFRF